MELAIASGAEMIIRTRMAGQAGGLRPLAFSIYAYDFNCVCLAHGYTPELVGRDLSDKKDSKGLLVIQKLRDAAKEGKGFVEFGWNDPATGKEGRKLGYVVKIDETLWLGSGIYLK